VDDPIWATQLRFLEADLLGRLAAVAGEEIERIHVVVRR
jgi:Dna[CI] antecedent, DciA